jgi:CRP-like cAMP-binding protein
MSMLTAGAHSATARARTNVETAVLGHRDLAELIRLRPDIGLHIYRNLAVGMGEKLNRASASLEARQGPAS